MKMKTNERLCIVNNKTVIVPYCRKHVLKYHEWMKSEELQRLTASEPLTLEEEYQMQLSWRQDEDKCTFIVLDKEKYGHSAEREIESMIGDVNLFFNEPDDRSTAEIEIMIAEPTARGKGQGREALLAMLRYGFEDLGVCMYTAKIGFDNQPSISLFTKIGFVEVSRSEVFKEISFALKLTEAKKEDIKSWNNEYSKQDYPFEDTGS